jgi:flagellin
MANSVNTNYGATIALQSLNKTNRELDAVQKRVSTGFRVADAKDDGASFAVAQGLRADVKGNEAVNERLSVAKGLLSVTQEGLKGISDTVGEIRKVIVKLSDGALSADERTQYNADYTALRADITKYIGQSSFGGINMIGAGAAAVNVISDAAGGTIALTARDLSADLTTLGGNPADAAAAQALLTAGTGALDVFEGRVNSQLAAVGANSRSVENQDAFIKVLGSTINDAIGSIVDADLAKESAKLQALQIRQQLGTQTLSIANQAPSALLSLFQ